jgi:hypothetical protein
MSDRNLAKALLIAPSVAPLLYCGIGALLMAGKTNQGGYLGMVATILSFGLPVSYVATFIVGLPIYTFLKRQRLLTTYSLSFSGALSGAIVMLLFTASLGGIEYMVLKEVVNSLLLGFLLGGVVAFAFGRIAGITTQPSPTR